MNWPKYYLVQDIPPPGGGGTQQIFIRGGSTPRTTPLPFYIPFFHEKGTPFVYFLCEKKKNFASLLNAKNALSCKKVPLPEKGTPSALPGGASRV